MFRSAPVPVELPLLATLSASTLSLCLALACVTDVRERRIPNVLVAATAVAGIGFSLLGRPSVAGFAEAVGGMAAGLAVWLPFYILGMLGAGDVKLFAAASAWLGPLGAMKAAALTAFAGGGMALVLMLAHVGPGLTVLRLAIAVRDPMSLRQPTSSRTSRMPYALAITAGVLGALWFPELL